MAQGTGEKPDFMYIYHLTDDHEADHPVYLIQLDPAANLESALTSAMPEILAGTGLRVPSKPNSAIEWRVRSYAAFVLVSEGQELSEVKFCYDCKEHKHAFKHPKRVAGPGWTAVIYQNKRLKHDGSPLGDSQEPVRWDAIHHRKGGSPLDGKAAHNSSDTNVGP